MIKQIGKKTGFIFAIAGAAVVGGTTTALVTAAIPSTADGQIHSCYRNNASFTDAKGALRVIDSDANQVCTAQETALNLSQGTTPVLKDASGQVLGNVLDADDPGTIASVYNHSIKRVISISYASADSEYKVGQQEAPLFATSDCTGQPYTQQGNQTLLLKTSLFRWNNGDDTVYGVVADNANEVTINAGSLLTSVDNVTFYCESQPGDMIQAFPLSSISLPFNVPISTPVKF